MMIIRIGVYPRIVSIVKKVSTLDIEQDKKDMEIWSFVSNNCDVIDPKNIAFFDFDLY